MDEDALNTMLAEGVDLPTAVAGSADDRKPIREGKGPKIVALIVAAIVGGVVWYLLR